jgi:alkylation response protein AidB-like acyl-CoA dehydrogenase
MGLSAGKQLIMIEEFERYGCARLTDHGVIYLGPLLIQHGTEEQKRFFLPRIISGEHTWCQGYSEPNAGSDLASLATEAVLSEDGEHWIVNGQKTWTTWATDANWIYLLVRTDKTVKKQEGISFLLVPMDSPGITVRPIVTIDLQDEFCETFFDNVKVPRQNLVGAINSGWSMAKALLSFERIFVGSPKLSSFALSRLRRLAEYMKCWSDPVFQERYTRLRLDLEDLRMLYQVYYDAVRRGERLGPDVSMLKIWQTELYQRITETMLDIGGDNTALLDPIGGDRELFPGGMFLQARASSIYAGSNEIQRNIIAKNVLQLPS